MTSAKREMRFLLYGKLICKFDETNLHSYKSLRQQFGSSLESFSETHVLALQLAAIFC